MFVAAIIAAIVALPFVAGANSETWSGNVSTDAPLVSSATEDTTSAIVQLQGDPLATYKATAPPPGKKIDFSSTTVKSYRAQLAAERNDFAQWLQANYPKAQITGQFDIALNAVSVNLNGTSLTSILAGPQVQSAQYEGLYQPTYDATVDPDLSLIKAYQAWTAASAPASPPNAGAGIKVGMIDTGIDINNPCFNDAGYTAPAGFPLGDKSFTNNKVIVARVFNEHTPVADFTPEAIQEHGTHTAGTVACDYGTAASVSGVTIPNGISGVAPHAYLGNYNVFPALVMNARSEDIFKALESAYTDGMDVVNMSLGGGYHGSQDLLTHTVNALDNAGMISAIAAGNSGPGFSSVQSPGAAADGLTAGASTVGHFIGVSITAGGTPYPAATGTFSTFSTDTTKTLIAVKTGSALSTACTAISSPALTSSDVALVARGTCSFSTKIRNAQTAGAGAVIVANNVQGDPIAMGQDGTPNQPTIQAYMVSRSNGATLAALSGSSVTIGGSKQYFITPNSNFMAGFSSQGPTRVDFRVKPDVVAPGVNVLSSIPNHSCGATATSCFAFFQGTSMATPHLAGSAAVVLWEHPDWTAAEIRSAIVNTAQLNTLKSYNTGSLVTNPLIQGAGLENLFNAVGAQVALDPVSVSFGPVPSGSGQTRTATITLTNLTNSTETLTLTAGADGAGVSFIVSPSSVTIPAGGSTSVTVGMVEQQGTPAGNHYTYLQIMSGGTFIAHAALYTFVTS
jgi:subtilisin family serine protease